MDRLTALACRAACSAIAPSRHAALNAIVPLVALFHAGSLVEATGARIDPWAWPALMVAGATSWFFGEYAIHRWVYHGRFKALRAAHMLHHADPLRSVGMPWVVAVMVGLASHGIVHVLSPRAPGPLIVFAGFWTGYVAHTLAHAALHRRSFRSRVLRRLRRHHLLHHRIHAANYGVTATFVDRAFGTHAYGVALAPRCREKNDDRRSRQRSSAAVRIPNG